MADQEKTANSAQEGGVMLGNRFVLTLGKNTSLSFSRVSNITRALDYETIVEGGVNDRVHTLTKPKQQAETLILEKGVNAGSNADIREKLEKLGLKPGGRIKEPVVLGVYSPTGDHKYYSFENGVVVRWELSNLDALGNEVLVEKFEIAHSGLTAEG
jgi:phage tail-like protein